MSLSKTETLVDNDTRLSTLVKNQLTNIGIFFKPGSFEDIYRITSRDTDGGRYPYNAGFYSYGQKRERHVIESQGVEIGYYTGITRNKRSKIEGEIGMVHLAPAVRGKKISSLICLLGYMELIEAGAEELRAFVGDETGRIAGLLNEVGFQQVHDEREIAGHTVWKKEIEDKDEALSYLYSVFQKKINGLDLQNLKFDSAQVDIDNPRRVQIKETVLARLGGKAFKDGERILFGYCYAPVLIYQEQYQTGARQMFLRLMGRTKKAETIFKKYIKRYFSDQSINIIQNSREPLILEISPHCSQTDADEQSSALALVAIANDFIKAEDHLISLLN